MMMIMDVLLMLSFGNTTEITMVAVEYPRFKLKKLSFYVEKILTLCYRSHILCCKIKRQAEL